MGGAVGGIIGAVGSIAGGAMGSDAADSAAKAQEKSAQAAVEEQRRQYDQTRSDMEPWRQTGGLALNQLSHLMGLAPNTGGASQAQTREQIRAELLPQYTSGGGGGGQSQASRPGGQGGGMITPMSLFGGQPQQQYVTVYDGTGSDQDTGRQVAYNGGGGQGQSIIDEAGLNAAIEKRLAEQQAAQQQAMQAAGSDHQFGSLLRRFSMDDYLEDPGYKFRLQQGEQAINRGAAAAGRYDSGRALKDLNEFNSGLASQEFGNSYNRWNNDMSNIYNRLSGVAGTGQQAVNNLASLGAQSATNIGNAQMQAGNARASGYIGKANAWSGALGGATNSLAQIFG
ncbi:hypothetical protein H0A71_06590 [Alcaligenaceae bacterium]|nr:hypothetical protein [Alcaligenaceae bacterium]